METDILTVVSSHPEGIWLEEIARALHKNRQTISKYVGQLEARKQVRVQQEGQMKRVYLADGGTAKKQHEPSAKTAKASS